jgi:hypothetical protein
VARIVRYRCSKSSSPICNSPWKAKAHVCRSWREPILAEHQPMIAVMQREAVCRDRPNASTMFRPMSPTIHVVTSQMPFEPSYPQFKFSHSFCAWRNTGADQSSSFFRVTRRISFISRYNCGLGPLHLSPLGNTFLQSLLTQGIKG